MKIGFTGTRKGLRLKQLINLNTFLGTLKDVTEFHHGDCIGGDNWAHDMFKSGQHAELRRAEIHVHPPDNPKHRAWRKGDKVYSTKPYLVRNKDIVNACDLLIACPNGPEKLRSGTWSTVRYANEIGKKIAIFSSDGHERILNGWR